MHLPQQETNHFERMPDELVLKVLPRPRGQTKAVAVHVFKNQTITEVLNGVSLVR